MTSPYQLVLVPREAANDDHATLISWVKADGQPVKREETICTIEFSKSVTDLVAPADGWLFHLHEPGVEVPIGQPVAVIAFEPVRPVPAAASTSAEHEGKITAKARKLMEEHGLSPALFRGQPLVKEEHVRQYLAEQGKTAQPAVEDEGELILLSPVRRRAATTLATSKQTIPHSYLSRWIPAEAVESRVAALGREKEMMLSLSDLLTAVVARTASQQPAANSSWHDQGILRHAHVHVGFALNQPNGELLVPVVRNAEQLSLLDLVGSIRTLQKRAVRHQLSPQDLSGGTITVTSLLGSGVHQALPILVPGQAIIIALADRCEWPAPSYCLTAAFDHRILNGVEAAAFLVSVARYLQGESEV
jgi:pyruvate/2-oxoglutarate dehydrogenase complex dihydrolipoamide acyltransferase (E2) component